MRDGEAAREDPKIPTASGVHDVHEEEEQPLPKKQVFAIWLTQTVMGIHITLPFTLAVYMVRSFYDDGNSVNEKTVATLTGLLAATMSGANFLSSFPWGMFSDRFGRKVTVLIGCFASATCMLTLGLSQTYLAAFLSRFFAGFFNGAGVGTNTMIGESLTPVNQALVMGYGNLGWGIGNILGPVVGGYCSVPCETMAPWFPLCGEGQLFKTRPFLLPCLVAGGLALLAFLVNIALMHETHPRLQNRGGHWGATLKSLGGYRRVLQSEQEEIKGDRGKLPAAAELSTGINVHSMHSAPSGTELELVAVESGLHTPVAQVDAEELPSHQHQQQSVGPASPSHRLAFRGVAQHSRQESKRDLSTAGTAGSAQQAELALQGTAHHSVQSGQQHLGTAEHSASGKHLEINDLPDSQRMGGSAQHAEHVHPRQMQPDQSLSAFTSPAADLGGSPAGKAGIPSSHLLLSSSGHLRLNESTAEASLRLGQRHSSAQQAHSLAQRSHSTAQSSDGDSSGHHSSEENNGLYANQPNQPKWGHGPVLQLKPQSIILPQQQQEGEQHSRNDLQRRKGHAALPRLQSAGEPAESSASDHEEDDERAPLVSTAQASTSYTAQHTPHAQHELSNSAGLTPASTGADLELGKAAILDSDALDAPVVPWYRQTTMQLCLLGAAMCAFLSQFFQELTPVFAAAPQALGGLGMPAYELAFPMSVSGIFLIVFSLLVYPRLVRKLGPLAACKLGMVTGIPPGFIVPSASLLLGFPTLKVAVLCLGLGTRGIAALLSLSSSQILLNALAPRDQIGAVNGVAASMQALVRSLGPACGGSSWALAVALSQVPYHQFLPYLFVSGCYAVVRVMYGRVQIALPVRQPSRVDLEE